VPEVPVTGFYKIYTDKGKEAGEIELTMNLQVYLVSLFDYIYIFHLIKYISSYLYYFHHMVLINIINNLLFFFDRPEHHHHHLRMRQQLILHNLD